MKAPAHFETSQRQSAVIATLVNDLTRTVQLLSCDIAIEEERTFIRDAADPQYSTLARALGKRRQNLNVTLASLRLRLAALQDQRQDAAA
jgi:hypothetical protein